MQKVGVFLCTGCDIGKAVKTDDFEDLCKEGGASHFMAHECLCGPEGVKAIHKAIEDGTVDGVVIAACSQRAKTDEFRFDPLKVGSERCALREQVAWSHPHGEEDTQMLAEDLLRMYITRVSKMELPKPLGEQINGTVLVVGGGLAGLTAAKAAASLGRKVVVAEKSDRLGGYLANVKDLVPEEPPYDIVHENYIGALVSEVESNAEVSVIKGCTIKSIDGQPGQFKVQVKSSSGDQSFEAGTIVQATGARPYDANQLGHLGYGKSPNVVGSNELEKMLKDGKLARPSDGKEPKNIVFVQCAGSRDENHLPYCSSECCVTTLKQVATIHRDFPKVQCQVVYKDLRAPGQLEHFYLGVSEKTGCMLTRGEVDSVEGDGTLSVNIKQSLLGDAVTLQADMVVLALGMVPTAADGEAIRELRDAHHRAEHGESEKQKAEAKKKVEELKRHEGTEILNLTYRQGPDLPALRYGFPDSHYICFPYESRRTGIYAAGTTRAPMDAGQAAEDGWGAAMKAVQCLSALERGEAVHPRSGDIAVADFSLQRCTQCKRCTEECPFGTLNEDQKGTPQYNTLRCRRCGICLGSCPERIVAFPEYSVDAVAGMIKSIEVPEEEDEKPRMVALVCENDALPALDEAAAKRKQWNPWVRIIPVRCLGACNVVWIADSLSRGIDGVILIGCKKGDDYQCHYIKGSELAEYRMDNVKETLERLTLESERVRIVELARDEFERVPEILDDFAEKIEEVGPNPYKGF